MKWKKILPQIFVFCCILLTFLFIWAKQNFGSVGMEEIVFQMRVPLKGVANDLYIGIWKNIIVPTIVAFLTVLFWRYFPFDLTLRFKFSLKKEKSWSIVPLQIGNRVIVPGCCLWILVLLVLGNREFDLTGYLRNQFTQSELIEDYYIDPRKVEIVFPEKKRNLICIYMESGETSAQDQENGGLFSVNYIPELTELAKNNISFSQSEKIEGAAVAPECSWTIAGLVATTTGLPSKFTYDTGKIAIENYEYFLPGVYSLGEILEEEGYKNYFVAGSNFDFGGRRTYFQQHGNYEIWDYFSAITDEFIPDTYKVWWGMEDAKLFEYSKEKLLQIAEKDEPFNFSLLTVDTHQPNGYLCENCESGKYDKQYANVYACASKQIADFVSWIQQQDFYENTTIVICGDHLSVNSTFWGKDAKDEYVGEVKRKVYNAFINPCETPEKEKNRKFTTLDMFPSILGSIGVQIEGERLGLGTNLFSTRETLSEELGYEVLFTEISKKSNFYDKEFTYYKGEEKNG